MNTVFWASLIFQPWVRFENIGVVRMPSWLTYSCLSSFCSYITPAPYRSFCNGWLETLFQPKLTKHKLIFYLWFSCFQFAILSPNIGNLILERQEYQACFFNPRHYGTWTQNSKGSKPPQGLGWLCCLVPTSVCEGTLGSDILIICNTTFSHKDQFDPHLSYQHMNLENWTPKNFIVCRFRGILRCSVFFNWDLDWLSFWYLVQKQKKQSALNHWNTYAVKLCDSVTFVLVSDLVTGMGFWSFHQYLKKEICLKHLPGCHMFQIIRPLNIKRCYPVLWI